MAWHFKESFICQNWRIRKKWSTFDLRFNYFVLPASVGVSHVATQFHVSNSDGRMSKGVKTSQRCEWLIVTSRNVSSKINVKLSKVQIPISFLIIWIFWSNKNEFTLHIMTCMKTTESQNGQIYLEDTFSHGAAHIYSYILWKNIPGITRSYYQSHSCFWCQEQAIKVYLKRSKAEYGV